MDSSRDLMGVVANNERLDRAAGRTLSVLYGMQVLGGSIAFWMVGLIGWIIGSTVMLVFGVVIGSALVLVGVRSLRSKNRLSDFNPDDEGIEFD